MRGRGRSAIGRSGLGRALAAAAALAIVLAASAARAESGKGAYVGTYSFAASLGYAVPNTDEYDNSFAWRIAAGYSPMPRLEFDLEVGGFSVDVTQPEANGLPSHTIASGSLDVRPVCLTLQVRTPVPELLSTVSLLAGVGYYFVDYAMADESRAALEAARPGASAEQSVDDAWGFHVGAAVEYAMTERVSLAVDVRYLFLQPDASGPSGADTSFSGSLDLNTWIVSGGIKVAF